MQKKISLTSTEERISSLKKLPIGISDFKKIREGDYKIKLENSMKNTLVHLDEIDKAILTFLQTDAAISNAELAEKVGLSPSACLSRTKNLKKKGVIKQYTAVIDEQKVGFAVMAFTFVTLSPHNREVAEAFYEQIRNVPQVMECYNITGNWDYLLKIVSPSIEVYRDFIMDSLLTIHEVNKVETLVVLKSEKQSGVLPFS